MKSWKLGELQEAAKSPAGVFFVARPTASQKKPRVAACFFRGYGEDNEEEQGTVMPPPVLTSKSKENAVVS